MKTSDPITNLINALSRLPGIGERTASRLAFYILNASDDLATDLSDALTQVKERIGFCKRCCNLTEDDYCHICANAKRDRNILAVVESTPDLRAIENTGEFRGTYHVLHGLISPLEGIGPDDIRVAELLRRLLRSIQGEMVAGEGVAAGIVREDEICLLQDAGEVPAIGRLREIANGAAVPAIGQEPGLRV